MIKKLYIGIDPDLRLLNAAIVTDQKQALAVFKRKNTGFSGDRAVAQAVVRMVGLLEDIKDCIDNIKEHLDPTCTITVIVESQNMEHARKLREEEKKKVNYQNLLQLGQISGIVMGVLSAVSSKTILVQAYDWKGTISKKICHNRYYTALNLKHNTGKKLANIYPENMASLCYYSKDKINPGDFMDINDSLGLALYGAKKGL